MIKIQYQILRYLPDRVAGEFVNLGVIAFDPLSKTLQGRFISRIGKISAFFPQVNSRYLIKSVGHIQEYLERVSKQLNSELSFETKKSLIDITQSVLPNDDTSLIFTEVKHTLDINVEAAVADFFNRFVKGHEIEEDDEIRRDAEVWNKVYKKHFDDYGISRHLKAHKVKTRDDVLEFDRAWKNGIWNCFETVSFNLNKSDSIKNKVYKWMGKLDELNSSKEPLCIYLLSVLPHEHPELTGFINKKFKSKSTKNTKIEIVNENNIDQVAKKIRKQILEQESK
jgi:hypothetical protein